MRPPPGMNSMSARRMFAALRSTRLMLIGFTPRMIVNIRKPGIRFALSAKKSSGLAMPNKSPCTREPAVRPVTAKAFTAHDRFAGAMRLAFVRVAEPGR